MTAAESAEPGDPVAQFPALVAGWLGEHGALIDALVVLRRPPTSADGVAALLALGPVAVLRACWELWRDLGAEAGADVDDLLDSALGTEVTSLCRCALWGPFPAPDWRSVRLVER
jgi:hypothetical protein